MNIIVIPFHDWRKFDKEGFRTRDAHIIQHLLRDDRVSKLVIINRPITYAEIIFKKINWKTKGICLYNSKKSQLVQVDKKGYVFDFLSYQILNQILKRKQWFFKAYGIDEFFYELNKALEKIEFKPDFLLSENVFAYDFCRKYSNIPCIFDAFDNLLKFSSLNANIKRLLYNSYLSYSSFAKIWVTNSDQNKKYYEKELKCKNIQVIRNGVDVEIFRTTYGIPKDLRNISRPIIGIGAKITHLLDVNLINYLTDNNPSMNIVLIGQIIDKKNFNNIKKRDNFWYLGDKHYEEYPAYLKYFDVCILPYVTWQVGTWTRFNKGL